MPFHYFLCNDVVLHICSSRFFKESSDEEREHAEKLMEYQVSFGPLISLTLWSVPLHYATYWGTDTTLDMFFVPSEQTWRQGEAPIDCDALDRI